MYSGVVTKNVAEAEGCFVVWLIQTVGTDRAERIARNDEGFQQKVHDQRASVYRRGEIQRIGLQKPSRYASGDGGGLN